VLWGNFPRDIPRSTNSNRWDSGRPAICSVRANVFPKTFVKNTYGTGCFLLINTGEQTVFSKNGLLTSIGWGLEGKVTYVLEGSVFIAGAAVQWLRDELGFIKQSEEIEALARRVPDNGGVYFLPAFVGLGAPHWDMYAKA